MPRLPRVSPKRRRLLRPPLLRRPGHRSPLRQRRPHRPPQHRNSSLNRRDAESPRLCGTGRILDLMASDLDYKGYLKLEQLLQLQEPLAQPPAHDETLFIIVHQVFELWFRLVLHELDKVFELLDQDDVIESERLIRRLTSIIRLFVPKLSVLETMLPSDFIEFRDRLRPASGFQSVQFREIEFASGSKDRRYFGMFT